MRVIPMGSGQGCLADFAFWIGLGLCYGVGQGAIGMGSLEGARAGIGVGFLVPIRNDDGCEDYFEG